MTLTLGVLGVLVGIFVGLLLADLTTAGVHWAVDNYAHRDWPLIGPHYVAFAHDHHDDPLAILRLSFVRCHWFILTFAALMALGLYVLEAYNVVTVSALTFGAATNVIHGWSHTDPERLNRFVRAAQNVGLLQSPIHHDIHHTADDRGYALLTDFINPLLDRSGIFPLLEAGLSNLGLERHWWEQAETATQA